MKRPNSLPPPFRKVPLWVATRNGVPLLHVGLQSSRIRALSAASQEQPPATDAVRVWVAVEEIK